jgi:hypothetical protein
MTSFEEIGALLGFLAFAGLAVLVFLTFQQGRNLRRLRDWAGRAPERAAALAARDLDPVGDEVEDISQEELESVSVLEPSRFDRARDALSERWAEIDRRSPVDPKLLLGGLAAVILGVGIATSGFGVLGDGGTPTERSGDGNGAEGRQGGNNGNRAGGSQGENSGRTEVAVLNGTAPPGGTGVPGVADRVSQSVKDAGFTVGAVDNAGSFSASTVMWTGSAENQAKAEELAEGLAAILGETTVVEMTPEVEAVAGGAEIALVVGQDDATI